MKKPGAEIFGETGGKWTAVSAKIRSLYDSVLKESVPQNLKASSQFTSVYLSEVKSIEPERTPEAVVHISPAVTDTDLSVSVPTSISIEQGEISSPLSDPNTGKPDRGKN
jgi:hypothetical protein